MRFIGKAVTGCLLAGSVLAVAACGSSSSSSSSGGASGSTSGSGGNSANTVDIYSSLPMQGSSTAQTIPLVNGIKLALSQAGGKAGKWNVNYIELDDSTAAAGKWDPTQTAADARKAASDPKAVYYIGEFNSGASEVSIPILNQAGVPQVSPANTYVGLTTNEPGSAPGEPQKYYPTGTRTFLRIVPRDSIQAAADLIAMKQAGCTRVAVANDKEAYGSGLADLLELEKADYGVNIVSNTGIDPTAPNFRSYAADDQGTGRRLLPVRRDRRQRRRADHQGRAFGAADREDLRPRRDVHELVDERGRRRRAGGDRPVHPVHGRDPGPEGLPGRQGLPRRLQGQVRRRQSGPVRDLRL